MDEPSAAQTEKRKRPDLSAERIATEAMALIDDAGLDGFSFRTLAGRLGCKAMSIYHYYPSKAHLFEALNDVLIGENPIPTQGSWRDKLRNAAHGFRQTALRHPGFFLFFAIFRMNNASGMGFLNRLLGLFEETGLNAEDRARHFRAYGYYLMGAGLDEAMGYAHGPSAVVPVSPEDARRDYPAIAAVGPYFAAPYHAAIFETGLAALLDAVEADIAKTRQRRGA